MAPASRRRASSPGTVGGFAAAGAAAGMTSRRTTTARAARTAVRRTVPMLGWRPDAAAIPRARRPDIARDNPRRAVRLRFVGLRGQRDRHPAADLLVRR